MVIRGERGQATVELVALVPALMLVFALVWQFALAGHAQHGAAAGARAGARAVAVGADATAAARAAVTPALRRGLRVKLDGARVEVSVVVPAIVLGTRLTRVTAHATFAGQPVSP